MSDYLERARSNIGGEPRFLGTTALPGNSGLIEIMDAGCTVQILQTWGSVAPKELQMVSAFAEDWREDWRKSLENLSESFGETLREHLRQAALEQVVLGLRNRVRELEAARSIIVPIQSFGNEPVELLKTIHVVVQPSDGEYLATFFDANINASGDTEVEAVENLKSLMLDYLDLFGALETKDKLGAEPARQLGELRKWIRPLTA